MPADLDYVGIKNVNQVFRNLSTPALYEAIIRRREGVLAHLGPIVTTTGHYTGRSPDDKFTVREPETEKMIWWGKINRPFEPEAFDRLHARLVAYLQGKDIFIQDCYAGASAEYRVPLRIITENAWHNLFARNMFVRTKNQAELNAHVPEFTLIHAPRFQAFPDLDGTNSEAFVLTSFSKRLILIGGTGYAGEIKKSVFTVMNYILPQENVLGMHCSANRSESGDTAVFFGLSGTGKTTLSADPDRYLIGDDEHGWNSEGVFNFEGGCYAKVIRLDPEGEPEIHECTRRFGTILENVSVDMKTRMIDLDSAEFTENTRASYPVTHLLKIVPGSVAGHPNNIIMLTCDAFGVLPPIAKLTPAQAKFHFLSGYTAKVAGTERGVTEPKAIFSACFGAPFMALHPTVYADLLGKRIEKHNVNCWLINTGWTGGPYGRGERIKLRYTRAMVRAALNNQLDGVNMTPDPVFGLQIPDSCPEVPTEVLNPRNTWADKDAFDRQIKQLAAMFRENFREYEEEADIEVRKACPKHDA